MIYSLLAPNSELGEGSTVVSIHTIAIKVIDLTPQILAAAIMAMLMLEKRGLSLGEGLNDNDLGLFYPAVLLNYDLFNFIVYGSQKIVIFQV